MHRGWISWTCWRVTDSINSSLRSRLYIRGNMTQRTHRKVSIWSVGTLREPDSYPVGTEVTDRKGKWYTVWGKWRGQRDRRDEEKGRIEGYPYNGGVWTKLSCQRRMRVRSKVVPTRWVIKTRNLFNKMESHEIKGVDTLSHNDHEWNGPTTLLIYLFGYIS